MADIRIEVLGAGDLERLLGVPEDLFDHAVKPDQARAFLEDRNCIFVLASIGGEVAGFASGTILLHPDKAPSLFINEVGTLDEFLRRGVGKATTQALIDEGRRRGCDGAWLGTEPENAEALALYRSLKGDERLFVGFGWDGAFDLE